MRDYYLHARYDRDHGMRGGVGHGYDRGMGEEYELEIGNNANASPEMIALCCLQDEIMEFLEASPSALSDLLLTMHSQKMAEIAQRYEENKEAREVAKKAKAFKAKYNE
jgi:hypothetical protein